MVPLRAVGSKEATMTKISRFAFATMTAIGIACAACSSAPGSEDTGESTDALGQQQPAEAAKLGRIIVAYYSPYNPLAAELCASWIGTTEKLPSGKKDCWATVVDDDCGLGYDAARNEYFCSCQPKVLGYSGKGC
jgi:hypothetical protein